MIDKHMRSIGASKLSLSSITSEDLQRRSGRYSENAELLRLKDRKESGFLLSPTHEEKITTSAAGIVKSYKDLPLRVYQISRKYRDERRPRQGLLRAKEFLMKDLYTFDSTPKMALETYSSVRKAYAAFFDELKIPYVVADADSGAMGGNLSHEYHFVSPIGEDHVCSCNKCHYVANEELAEKGIRTQKTPSNDPIIWHGMSKDRNTLVRVYIPKAQPLTQNEGEDAISNHLNIHAVKAAYPDMDTSIENEALERFGDTAPHLVRIFDHPTLLPEQDDFTTQPITTHPKTAKPLDLTRIHTGDPCPRCLEGLLTVQRAMEAVFWQWK